MDLLITHDGHKWIASNEHVSFSGRSLDELDEEVRRYVWEHGDFSEARPYRVKMHFNNAVIPQWMRQYQQHYFNRILVVDPPSQTSGGRP